MTRLLASILAVVSWVAPAIAEPSDYLKNIGVVSYVVSVQNGGGDQCKVDKANLETSPRFLANSSRLKFIPASVGSEAMPTLFFQIITLGKELACAADIDVLVLGPAYSAMLKPNNVELLGPKVFLWRQGYLILGPPSDHSARTIAKAEEYFKQFVNDWSASQ
jgi:hypothetical protein